MTTFTVHDLAGSVGERFPLYALRSTYAAVADLAAARVAHFRVRFSFFARSMESGPHHETASGRRIWHVRGIRTLFGFYGCHVWPTPGESKTLGATLGRAVRRPRGFGTRHLPHRAPQGVPVSRRGYRRHLALRHRPAGGVDETTQ